MSENSPEPGTPQTGYKAYAATALAFICLFATFWIADTAPFTAKEAVAGLISAAVGSGLTGGITYAVKNRAK